MFQADPVSHREGKENVTNDKYKCNFTELSYQTNYRQISLLWKYWYSKVVATFSQDFVTVSSCITLKCKNNHALWARMAAAGEAQDAADDAAADAVGDTEQMAADGQEQSKRAAAESASEAADEAKEKAEETANIVAIDAPSQKKEKGFGGKRCLSTLVCLSSELVQRKNITNSEKL